MKHHNTQSRFAGLRAFGKKAAVASVGLAAVPAFADAGANPMLTALNNAVSQGHSNYTIVVVGLIGLAAIGFGLRMIVGAMK